ncbi:barstar family protein [Paenibacillus sp. LHD-117]|uniref:barstar family protein n=1 Tax=Paenibacillus sp. LHD-117 TaxID=3071412 RepID=UPI0027DEAF96|nr:barstar family protein [Paenibacillus sp. LHD-117]MDQ6419582.1 barstar family protein [Paenibacillus sp. LHD-117]
MAPEFLWKSLMKNGSIVLFWSQSRLEKNVERIKEEKFDVYLFDCASWDSEKCLLEVGETLNFPDYYGKNLDALHDCLSDIVPQNEGFVLVFKNFDSFYKIDKETAYHLLDIIQINAWRLLLEEQKKLMAFVQSNDPDLHIKDVGAFSVDWNSEEWLKSSRR